MSKWNLVVSSGGIMSKKILDINSCVDYLENIDQEVEMISIQEEEDDTVNGILDDIDGVKNGYDARRYKIGEALDGFCNNDEDGSEKEYVIILLDEEDRSNSILSREKPLLAHRDSKKPKASWTNHNNVEVTATINNLSDSRLATPNKNRIDLDLNPSEPLGKYQCFLCPLNYTQKNCLSNHLMKHFDLHRPFMCPVCEKTFPRMEDLHKHINCCADFRPYECEQCDKAFPTSSKLCQHRRRTHSGMSPFKCTKCDYRTFERSHINTHLATHRDERPFKCNYCSYASKSQTYLTSHERIHRNDKRYKCDVCYSSFVQSKALRYHRKTHFWNGLMVHRCRFCPSELASPHALRKHVEIVHSDFLK